MDLLAFAADAIFSDTLEGMSACVTPTKRGRAVLGEVTNVVNISPDKFQNSQPLQALFTSPTLNTPNAKGATAPKPTTSPLSSSGSHSVARGIGNGKSHSSPLPGTEVGTPGRNAVSPSQVSAAGLGSPLTPMSNLKLLTRIASMEQSLTSKKGLFQSQCAENSENISPPVITESSSKAEEVPQLGKLRRHKSDNLNYNAGRSELGKCRVLRKHPSSSDYPSISSPGNLVLEASVGQLAPLLDETSQRSECSRKDKSLGLLSEKFLEHFPMKVSPLETPRRLVIDEVATELGTERRRVYDIINVLESLSMAVRVQKNMYQWTGHLHLEHTLARLKGLALKMDLHSQLNHLLHHHSNKDQSCQQFSCIRASSSNGENNKPDSRREKSLGVLCQKFVMLLLVSPWPHILSLEHAVRLVVGETGEDGERLRTRGRRLYDIANVLTSLGLVHRIPSAKSFKYIGPPIEACSVNDDDTLGVIQRQSLLPSCVVDVGSDKSKENITCPGDHEVTPSTAPKPVQKRGRPRKLSPDFCASTLPVAKRSRLQRARSEDTACTNREALKLTRHPSLHDICQVAEMEREKLLQKEQQQLQNIIGKRAASSAGGRKLSTIQTSTTAVASSQPPACTLLANSLLQNYLGSTSHTRVPVALTFQSAQVLDQRQASATNTPTPSHLATHTPTPSHLATHTPTPSHLASHTPTPSHLATHTPTPSHLTANNATSAQPFTLWQSFPQAEMKPVQVGNRVVVYSSGGQEGAGGSSVILTRGSQRHNNSAVVRVITRSRGDHNKTGTPPQLLCLQPERDFQPLRPSLASSVPRIQKADNRVVEERNGFSEESRHSRFGPFAIYTASGSQITLRKLSVVESEKKGSNFTTTTHPPTHPAVEVAQTLPASQPSYIKLPIFRAGAAPPASSSVSTTNSPSTFTSHIRGWQPSPDGSSTDSELEEIFGDAFKFSSPKNLVIGNSSHDGLSTDKAQ